MRIGFFTPEYPPKSGGIGSYVHYLARELLRQGMQPLIILRGKNDRRYEDAGIPVYELGTPGVAPLNFPLVKKKVEKFLQKLNVDILHIHSSSMPVITAGMPVLVTAHSCIAEATKTYHRPIRDAAALYRNVMFPFYLICERRLVRSCRLLTVVSKSMAHEFERHHGVTSQVVWNAVDIERFNPGRNTSEISVLFVGMYLLGKGIIDLIAAAPAIAERHPGAKIYLVGAGPLKNYMLRRLKALNVTNVVLVDHIPHEKLIEYYQRSALFVLPSYYEGLPTTILEAMACGLPVVATPVGGIPDEVQDGYNGFLVPPKSPHVLAEKVSLLLENPALRKEMGQNSRRIVESKFTWEKIVERFVRIYQNLNESR